MARFAIAATLCAVLVVVSCGQDRDRAGSPAPPPAPGPSATSPGPAPTGRFAVGVRELRLARSADRPLRTLVLFPAVPTGRNPLPQPAPAIVTPRPGMTPRPGRYPLVLFSHGLHGSPERYSPAVASWAAAGFVVAVPAYPHTNKKAAPYIRADFVNQPADAEYVLREVMKLANAPGDPLEGHIDTTRIGAVGHSAGGYTTIGLFRSGHNARIKAGVVIAGWLAPGAYGGPPARMLFVHADNDRTIPIADGRAAFDRVPWAGKRFELLPGAGHAAYMLPGEPGYAEMDRLVTTFLLATLGGEQQAPLQRG
ncbi:alpha/beta hydrolase [Actinoplanes sp. NPDC051633]|uniref:alpha/beta hydrolase family protein n=1 Tax=Actinoplanes sp. NPDC051633 TaxID=3155670 RepID=UPI003448F527